MYHSLNEVEANILSNHAFKVIVGDAGVTENKYSPKISTPPVLISWDISTPPVLISREIGTPLGKKYSPDAH